MHLHHRTRSKSRTELDARGKDRLLQVFDGLLVALLFGAPLFMGGRHPVGRVVYLGLIAAMSMVWAIRIGKTGRGSYERCGLELPAVAAILLVTLQVTPLSARWLTALSPRLERFLPLWQESSLSPLDQGWSTLSIVPAATRAGLAWLMASVVLMVLLYQRFVTRHDLRRLVSYVAFASLAMALFSLTQYLASNGKFVWIYENPYRNTRDILRGPFYNQNHLAHCLILGTVPLWCIYLDRRREQRRAEKQFTFAPNRVDDFKTSLLGLSVPLVLFVTLLTQSRGGMLVAGLVVLLGAVGTWQGTENARTQGLRLMLALSAIVVALAIHGLTDVTHEASTLTAGSIEQLDQGAGRRQIWHSAREIIGQFTLTGVGVGGFRDAYPLYYAQPRQYDYGYAESGYLQVAAETGLAGFAVLLTAIATIVRRFWPLLTAIVMRRLEDDDHDLFVAVACGILASAVHAFIDFVWFVPACLVTTICFIVVALRGAADAGRAASTRPDSEGNSRIVAALCGFGATGLLFCILTWRALDPAAASIVWDSYLVSVQQDENEQQFTQAEADPTAELTRLRPLCDRLHQIIKHDPEFVPARLHLASLCLQQFELEQSLSDNPMSLAQIRDAAISSKFKSVVQQDVWLRAVMQERRALLEEALAQTRQTLVLSPFQGRAYVDLAELAFLHSEPSVDRGDLIRQALYVRPHDATVLFAAGREAAMFGDFARCVELWRRAYRQDSQLRQTIMAQIAPLLPAQVFMESFAPAMSDLISLGDLYARLDQSQQATVVAQAYLNRLCDDCSDESTTAYNWQQGYRLAAQLADPRAITIARRAVALDPLNDIMRRRLALELLQRGEVQEGIYHLEAYMRSNPSDDSTASKLAWAKHELR